MPTRNKCRNAEHETNAAEHKTSAAEHEPKQQAADEQAIADNLLPWADPYVAGLLLSHQRQAALNDSLRYLALQEAERFGSGDAAAWRHE